MVALVNNMSKTFNPDDFAAQLKGFQASDEARQRLFDEMLERYTTLKTDFDNLHHDYSSERDSRRACQALVAEAQSELARTKREVDDSSFVLALIDGDGVIFQDALLGAAANEGGSGAASKLQRAIRDHIASLYESSGTWPIMVQIYLSLDKLAHKLASVNLIDKPSDFRTFAQGFSLNQSLFNIIDVGHGKERADHKIKEMLRTFSGNPTCRHIIFGGCHDAGYVLSLDQYKHNAAEAARITLLESTPAWRGFNELPNFRRVRFDDVFRSTELPEYGHGVHSMVANHAPVSTAIKPAVSAPNHFVSKTTTSPSPQVGRGSVPPGVPPASSGGVRISARSSPTMSSSAISNSSLTAAHEPADVSWAAVGKNGTSPNTNISVTSKTHDTKKWAYYNKDEQRLDEPLPPRDKAAEEAIEKRMEKAGRNLCNHWHLNKGKCVNGAACRFQHEPKLSSAGLNALRYKTRSLACKDRYCQKIDCYMGHQCSFERDQGWCPFPDNCNLRHTHGMARTKASRWDDFGNMELL